MSPPPEAMIRLEHVSKVFPGSHAPAVEDLSLDVVRGETLALVGPSGCGKTTTLKMINRIVEPTSGTILVDGVDVRSVPAHELRRSIGYVIQEVGLFPHRTVAQNVATVPQLLGWDQARTQDRIRELIRLVGLGEDVLDRYPSELSGGQQQRVGVARALAADPPVMLMDEPFGAVDPIVRSRLQDELLELQSALRKTIVFVTHDVDEAIKLADRICVLNMGGVVEQVAPPEEMLRHPANDFVAGFLGGERGLKRLGLITVQQVGLTRGPVVEAGAPTAEARAVMSEHGTDWVGVLDGEAMVGWVGADQLDREETVRPELARSFLVTLECDSSLRQALDAVVTSQARMAVVVDEGRYLGMVDVERIAEEITE